MYLIGTVLVIETDKRIIKNYKKEETEKESAESEKETETETENK